ncbi:MAG: (d)CMP kinase [Anaerovoracaceae bacterium]
MKLIRIAIDGPGGAGKSTIAKEVSKKLKIDYVDTGAMYRAIALKITREGIALEDNAQLIKVLEDTNIDFENEKIFLDGEDVSKYIRTPEISIMASKCSAILEVREKLVSLQREMGMSKSIIMDGRDIGTNVLKDAEFKFFMTASPDERAQRRFKELTEKGEETTYKIVLDSIIERDKNDTTRKLNPLKPAQDSIILDTSGMTIKEVTDRILKEVKKDGDC